MLPLDKAVSSLTEYTAWVERVLELFTDDEGAEVPWFRGAADSRHKLIPGLYRTGQGREPNADDELRAEFSRKALPFVAGLAPRSDWDWYFLMQHYRAPTRLLDWTDSALVALFFALASWRQSELPGRPHPQPVVWALNPFSLNRKVGHYGPVNVDFAGVDSWLPPAYSGAGIPQYPIAIDPPFTAQRMLVQRSHFTLHGSDTRPLEDMRDESSLEGGLFKVTIDLSEVEVGFLLQRLAVLGVTETTIFPDLEGLSRELRREYQLD